jgi:hypothetical protein
MLADIKSIMATPGCAVVANKSCMVVLKLSCRLLSALLIIILHRKRS